MSTRDVERGHSRLTPALSGPARSERWGQRGWRWVVLRLHQGPRLGGMPPMCLVRARVFYRLPSVGTSAAQPRVATLDAAEGHVSDFDEAGLGAPWPC